MLFFQELINSGGYVNRGQRSYSIPISAISMANGRALEEVQLTMEESVDEKKNSSNSNAGGGGGGGDGGEETEMPLLPRSKS